MNHRRRQQINSNYYQQIVNNLENYQNYNDNSNILHQYRHNNYNYIWPINYQRNLIPSIVQQFNLNDTRQSVSIKAILQSVNMEEQMQAALESEIYQRTQEEEIAHERFQISLFTHLYMFVNKHPSLKTILSSKYQNVKIAIYKKMERIIIQNVAQHFQRFIKKDDQKFEKQDLQTIFSMRSSSNLNSIVKSIDIVSNQFEPSLKDNNFKVQFQSLNQQDQSNYYQFKKLIQNIFEQVIFLLVENHNLAQNESVFTKIKRIKYKLFKNMKNTTKKIHHLKQFLKETQKKKKDKNAQLLKLEEKEKYFSLTCQALKVYKIISQNTETNLMVGQSNLILLKTQQMNMNQILRNLQEQKETRKQKNQIVQLINAIYRQIQSCYTELNHDSSKLAQISQLMKKLQLF